MLLCSKWNVHVFLLTHCFLNHSSFNFYPKYTFNMQNRFFFNLLIVFRSNLTDLQRKTLIKNLFYIWLPQGLMISSTQCPWTYKRDDHLFYWILSVLINCVIQYLWCSWAKWTAVGNEWTSITQKTFPTHYPYSLTYSFFSDLMCFVGLSQAFMSHSFM